MSDPFLKAVYNGRQMALKVSANSVYGVCMACCLCWAACGWCCDSWQGCRFPALACNTHPTLACCCGRLHGRHCWCAALPGDLLLGHLLWTGHDHGDAVSGWLAGWAGWAGWLHRGPGSGVRGGVCVLAVKRALAVSTEHIQIVAACPPFPSLPCRYSSLPPPPSGGVSLPSTAAPTAMHMTPMLCTATPTA